ncbi:hypothetical protein [Sphingobium sp. KCTC 72723]|uniref:hypothetical protein n=1 Tax=Sphingobium sp. KCTC 72723 TaxID=2733867 RepID=UPI00165E8B7A|nr:hypothetical protein [Sphingobium sp. KCTC 72723]
MSGNRTLSKLAHAAGEDIVAALARLADTSLPPSEYGDVMTLVGKALGRCFAERSNVAGKTVYLAVTVEDADFLAAGIAQALDEAGAKTGIACFWNTRKKAADLRWLDVATITNEYREPLPAHLDHLLVVKSIISGACVVKTNLMHLLEDAHPDRIHIMAPVILEGAEKRLSSEFEAEIADKFEYWLLATDSEKDDHGNVLPGIGGEIYSRLGFEGQRGKNAHFPKLLKDRVLSA